MIIDSVGGQLYVITTHQRPRKTDAFPLVYCRNHGHRVEYSYTTRSLSVINISWTVDTFVYPGPARAISSHTYYIRFECK